MENRKNVSSLEDEALASVAGGANTLRTEEEIGLRVKSLINEQLDIPGRFLSEDKMFWDLGCDSLDVVDIVCCIEEEFRVKIDESELESLKTPDDIIAVVISKLGLN